MITKHEQARRMASYKQGGSRADMADRCGLNYATYNSWLSDRGLTVKRVAPYQYNIADTPADQRDNVRRFLIALCEVDRKHGPLNADQVMDAMEEWRPSRNGARWLAR